MILSVGRSKTINAEVLPKNASDPSISWSSSDENIATVTDGAVKALSKGKATITATAEGISTTCSLTVIPEGPDNNEIWYSSWGGSALTVVNEDGFGSNEYADGKGILTFDGDVTTIPAGIFKETAALRSVSLPETVTEIATNAFKDCSTLISVSIQEGVTYLGGNVFDGCNSLYEIQLPGTITYIGSFAFKGSAIKKIILPEKIERIAEWGLYGVTGMGSITIVKEVPFRIGARAFDETGDCPIYVPSQSLDTFKAASVWKEYAKRILPKED